MGAIAQLPEKNLTQVSTSTFYETSFWKIFTGFPRNQMIRKWQAKEDMLKANNA